MTQLKLQISIQHCINCSLHSWCCRHDANKYLENYEKLINKIKAQVTSANITFKQNSLPPNFKHLSKEMIVVGQDKYYDENTQQYTQFPKLGSFQIHVDGILIFSKLLTNKWPKYDKIINTVKMMVDDKILGNNLIHYHCQWKEKQKNKNQQSSKIFRIRKNKINSKQQQFTFDGFVSFSPQNSPFSKQFQIRNKTLKNSFILKQNYNPQININEYQHTDYIKQTSKNKIKISSSNKKNRINLARQILKRSNVQTPNTYSKAVKVYLNPIFNQRSMKRHVRVNKRILRVPDEQECNQQQQPQNNLKDKPYVFHKQENFQFQVDIQKKKKTKQIIYSQSKQSLNYNLQQEDYLQDKKMQKVVEQKKNQNNSLKISQFTYSASYDGIKDLEKKVVKKNSQLNNDKQIQDKKKLENQKIILQNNYKNNTSLNKQISKFIGTQMCYWKAKYIQGTFILTKNPQIVNESKDIGKVSKIQQQNPKKINNIKIEDKNQIFHETNTDNKTNNIKKQNVNQQQLIWEAFLKQEVFILKIGTLYQNKKFHEQQQKQKLNKNSSKKIVNDKNHNIDTNQIKSQIFSKKIVSNDQSRKVPINYNIKKSIKKQYIKQKILMWEAFLDHGTFILKIKNNQYQKIQKQQQILQTLKQMNKQTSQLKTKNNNNNIQKQKDIKKKQKLQVNQQGILDQIQFDNSQQQQKDFQNQSFQKIGSIKQQEIQSINDNVQIQQLQQIHQNQMINTKDHNTKENKSQFSNQIIMNNNKNIVDQQKNITLSQQIQNDLQKQQNQIILEKYQEKKQNNIYSFVQLKKNKSLQVKQIEHKNLTIKQADNQDKYIFNQISKKINIQSQNINDLEQLFWQAKFINKQFLLNIIQQKKQLKQVKQYIQDYYIQNSVKQIDKIKNIDIQNQCHINFQVNNIDFIYWQAKHTDSQFIIKIKQFQKQFNNNIQKIKEFQQQNFENKNYIDHQKNIDFIQHKSITKNNLNQLKVQMDQQQLILPNKQNQIQFLQNNIKNQEWEAFMKDQKFILIEKKLYD